MIRITLSSDILQMQIGRNAVEGNMLSDPALVTDKDSETYITVHGKVGFALQKILQPALSLTILKKIIYGLCLDHLRMQKRE